MTDFVDPLEEPFDADRDPRPLDPDVDDARVDSSEADRQAAEDGTKVTSASAWRSLARSPSSPTCW